MTFLGIFPIVVISVVPRRREAAGQRYAALSLFPLFLSLSSPGVARDPLD